MAVAAAQEGFQYEKNAYEALKPYGITVRAPAGAVHSRADLEIKLPSDTTDQNIAGVELKLQPTTAGSLVMKYFEGKWNYGDTKGDIEKEFLKFIGEENNLLEIMNNKNKSKWAKQVPHLQNDVKGKKVLIGAKDMRAGYAKDIKNYGGPNEIKLNVPTRTIGVYYNKKNTHYMNVGTHGFYTMNVDPLNLNENLDQKIPDISTSATTIIRVRCQYKGGGDYQFVMTLQFSGVKPSPYNIAPLTGKSSINRPQLESVNNQKLWAAFRKSHL